MAKCPTKCKSQIHKGIRFEAVLADDRFDLDKAIQTKDDFFYAIVVMDKIEGWEEKSWVGAKFAGLWYATVKETCKSTGSSNLDPSWML